MENYFIKILFLLHQILLHLFLLNNLTHFKFNLNPTIYFLKANQNLLPFNLLYYLPFFLPFLMSTFLEIKKNLMILLLNFSLFMRIDPLSFQFYFNIIYYSSFFSITPINFYFFSNILFCLINLYFFFLFLSFNFF
jgi:hypothetical protein